MKAALIVHRVVPDVETNVRSILRGIEKASASAADLVLFAEAALTGLINDDCPSHDLPLGTEIPGQLIARLADAARAHAVWLGLGLLEREGARLYDSAVLFASSGQLALHYRRMQPQWHGQHADPWVYGQGTELPVAHTPFGTVSFLLCGDLFDDRIVDRFRALGADWMLCPLARCFSDGAIDQQRWEEEELPDYVERIRRAGITALIVNYLAESDLLGGAFGGAWVIGPDGVVLASLPLGKEGMLVVDLGGAAS
jgi:predicted amidohydrolase